ncbi:MAG: hypothetical protein KDB22_15470, partial [Planctomycetales bacterium]|nr:hypothetical protein [Planctomycetales bacterium]
EVNLDRSSCIFLRWVGGRWRQRLAPQTAAELWDYISLDTATARAIKPATQIMAVRMAATSSKRSCTVWQEYPVLLVIEKFRFSISHSFQIALKGRHIPI